MGDPTIAPDAGLRRDEGAPIPGAPATVAEVIDRWAREEPERIALADRTVTLSYATLDATAERTARALEQLGLSPGDRVAASLPNGVDIAVAFLAAMRAGLVWVGINRNLAIPEKLHLVQDSAATVLLTDGASRSALAGALPGVTVVDVDGERWSRRIAAAPPQRRRAVLDPFAPAAIAYTSGTTGMPKGVVHSQHNMLLPAAVLTATEPHTRLVQGVCLPLTILNVMILGVVQPLLAGARSVLMDRIDVAGVASWVREFGIEWMYGPPVLVYDLLTRSDVDPADLATLRHLGIGGAKLPDDLRRRYRERFGSGISVGYGLTEAPTSVTGGTRAGEPPRGSSGAARPHLAVTVRDEEGRPLPPGAEGEICVAAAVEGDFAGCYTPMLGYWRQPEATAAAVSGNVLHTGDVGMLDEDGFLYVLDRRTDLIVRGGANVYPAEVERVVEQDGRVADVAVLGREHPRLGEEVVAVVEVAPGASVTAADLAAHCAQRLARYKVPAAWYAVEGFPRNAMGKIVKPTLRRALEGHAVGAEVTLRPLS